MATHSSQGDWRVGILGAGSWGTALALLLGHNFLTDQRRGNVVLWGRDKDLLKEIAETRTNKIFLPKHRLPHTVHVQTDLSAALAGGDLIILATPSQAIRSMLEQIKPELSARHQGIVLACKGLDPHTNQLLHTVVAEVLGADFPCAYLAGPSFALEVAEKMPTLVSITSEQDDFAKQVAGVFRNTYFRTYQHNDMIGTGVSSSVKNIIAVAAGVSDGLGHGVNARAALIARGLAEMRRLVLHLGGQEQTVSGLAGLGDLVLTCTDQQSRNYRFGFMLAESCSPKEVHKKIGQVVEGAQSTPFICQLAKQHRIEMPICQAVLSLLQEQTTPQQATSDLLQRLPRNEHSL